MSQFITTTPLLNMRPVGSSAERSLPRMEAILEKEFKGRLSLRLAEPVERADKTGVDWYVDSDDALTQLTTLPEELADYYKRRLQADVSVIVSAAEGFESRKDPASQTKATALRTAVRYPGEDNIWLLGDVPSGKAAIVLTAWGYEPRTSELAGSHVIHRRERVFPGSAQVLIDQRPPANEPTAPGESANTGAVAATSNPRNWLGILSSVLWTLALVLPFVIGWFLLPACGVRVPFTDRFLFGWGDGAFCRQLPNPQMEASRSQSGMLTAQLGTLEGQVRSKIATCVPPRAEPVPDPLPDPIEEMKDRVREAGVELNDNETTVSLLWNTIDDLDLKVICPNGERISFSAEACGGKLEIDKNVETYTDHPIEHIRFGGSSMMPGRYVVEVKYFGPNGGRPPSFTPFEVIVQQEGKAPIIQSGSVQDDDELVQVMEFTVP